MATEKTQKNSGQYICEICDFKTSNKNDFNRHISTIKHSRNKNATLSNNEILKKQDIYLCTNCNKQYNDRTGLWRHKPKCNLNITNQTVDNNTNKDDIIQLLLKQNNELIKEQTDIKQIILEIVKNGTNNTINYNNNNSNNKTFNLQVFLNETCKDAMNISDFVESVKLQVTDLENVGKVGYIEGISNIIIKNLQALDISKRPVHCADQKREVMYVKDENTWEKEDENNKKLRKAIRNDCT
jgi:transposase-like protein